MKRITSLKAEIDHELFLTYITDRKGFLDSTYKSLIRIEGDRSDARFDHDSLPPEDDMDRILRYEERMHRQIDWAVQRLLESQERRTTLPPSPGTALPSTGTKMENEANKSCAINIRSSELRFIDIWANFSSEKQLQQRSCHSQSGKVQRRVGECGIATTILTTILRIGIWAQPNLLVTFENDVLTAC